MLERGSLVTEGLTDINLRVHSNLVLSRVTDQTLCISEGDLGRGNISKQSEQTGGQRAARESNTTYKGRGCPIALIIRNDFNPVISENTDTRVGSPEINTNSRCHRYE